MPSMCGSMLHCTVRQSDKSSAWSVAGDRACRLICRHQEHFSVQMYGRWEPMYGALYAMAPTPCARRRHAMLELALSAGTEVRAASCHLVHGTQHSTMLGLMCSGLTGGSMQLDQQLAAAVDVMEIFCDEATCVLAAEAALPGEQACWRAEVWCGGAMPQVHRQTA